MTKEHIYNFFFDKDKIKLDNQQEILCQKLYSKYQEFSKHTQCNFFTKLFSIQHLNRHCYVWGDVGRGKTMIMSALFDKIPTNKKIKFHFIEFIKLLHEQFNLTRNKKNNSSNEKITTSIAKTIASKYDFIYLDEFEINDIAEAMIIGKIFVALSKLKVTFLITSNQHPQNLYLKGFRREIFLKYLDYIVNSSDIFHLNATQDYRDLKKNAAITKLFIPNSDDNNQQLWQIFVRKINNNTPYQQNIFANKRNIMCKNTHQNIAWFEFDELFANTLSSNDYINIFKYFQTIFIINIPYFNYSNPNETKRFISFIDIAYQYKITIICTAQDRLNKLCISGKFYTEFKRTESRLKEMLNE